MLDSSGRSDGVAPPSGQQRPASALRGRSSHSSASDPKRGGVAGRWTSTVPPGQHAWAAAEGWNPGLDDGGRFLAAAPDAFLATAASDRVAPHGAIRRTVFDVLAKPGAPLSVQEVHDLVETKLGEAVSRSSTKNALASLASRADRPILRKSTRRVRGHRGFGVAPSGRA